MITVFIKKTAGKAATRWALGLTAQHLPFSWDRSPCALERCCPLHVGFT